MEFKSEIVLLNENAAHTHFKLASIAIGIGNANSYQEAWLNKGEVVNDENV